MSETPCCTGEGMKKGGWTTEEDKKLISYIHENGEGGWPDIPQKAGLKRTGKSCRLRWTNYLKPYLKSGGFSYEEEQIIIILHASHGNDWSVIARHLPKRTENEIENYWNTHLKERLMDKGLDTVTHKQLASNPSSSDPKKFGSEEEYNTKPEISNDEMPLQSDFLSCKKRFDRSSSTSWLLNKVAARGASIGKTLSTSIEGALRFPTSSSCLPNSLSQSSQHIDAKEDLSIPEYDFSQFLDQFINDDDQAKNIGGYDQNLLMSSEDNIIEDITDWSRYLLDHPDLRCETGQGSTHENRS